MQARNPDGTNITVGGATVDAVLTLGTASVAGTVVDHNNGTYDVSYTLNAAGDWTLDIRIGGIRIAGSPTAVHVNDLPATAQSIIVSVPLVTGGHLVIQARDASGTNITHGGASFTMSSTSPDHPVTMTSNLDGTYFGVPTLGGSYLIYIRIGGVDIVGSPVSVTFP